MSAADMEAWRKLPVGEKVRFRVKNLDSAFGAIFIPLKGSCCFMVMMESKADLLPNTATQTK